MNAISQIAVLLRNGKSVRQSADSGGLPITRIETIADGTINSAKVGFADLGEAECADWLLQDGDILISHINSTKHLGKCAIYEGAPSALVHGMNLLALRVDQDSAAPRYVYRMLSSPGFRRQLPRITKDSVNQSSFNISNFKKLTLPLPPLPEQKRIAGILDAADALRAKRRESLAQLDTLLQSTFLEMFGDPVTNPMGWEVRELADIVETGTIVTYGIVQAGDEYPGGVPYIRTGDLVDGAIQLEGLRHTAPEIAAKFERSRVRAGEIVMSIRATVGTTALVSEQLDGANLTQGTARISPGEHTEPWFLLSFIRSQGCQAWLQKQVKGATFREITLKRLRQMPIHIPPLDLQHRFAAIAESIEQQKTSQRAHLAELDTLFASLQSRAFRGDL